MIPASLAFLRQSLTLQHKLVLKSQLSSCLSLHTAGITGMSPTFGLIDVLI